MKIGQIIVSGILFSLALMFLAVKTFNRKNDHESGKELRSGEYVCSMHPQVIRNEPGDCPICGMFLIEVIIENKNKYDSALKDVVLPVNLSVPGRVKTLNPEIDTLQLIIEAFGVIDFDPQHVRTVSARFGGYIEESFIKYQFQYIQKGQKIYEIYCPGIYAERWNYVKMIQAYPERDDLAAEALQWLTKLGLSGGQVDSLKKAVIPDYHLPVYSKEEGYAVSLIGTGDVGLNEGIVIETGAPLFRLVNVKSLRADLKVKTEYASLLKPGQKVTLTDPAYPDKRFIAKIYQIEPFNDGLFQSVKAHFEDEEGLLVPGRQITARINVGKREGLWVPATAVFETGRRRAVMIMHENRFVASEVRTGIRWGDKTEILYGIDENSVVAEKASMLVDSDGFIRL